MTAAGADTAAARRVEYISARTAQAALRTCVRQTARRIQCTVHNMQQQRAMYNVQHSTYERFSGLARAIVLAALMPVLALLT